MKTIRLWLVAIIVGCASPAIADSIAIAAAADLKFAMGEIVTTFKNAHLGEDVTVTYGSSGNFHTQIQEGAPFDLYFSADIGFPRKLAAAGFAASDVKPYAFGRIVIWSASRDATKMNLESLTDPSINHVAVANPEHAPYGKRAMEALQASGVLERVKPKLVYGENIAQTAQFVETGNAEVGIIALALALNPALASKGGYWLVPSELHEPLEQGFIVTKRAENNALAKTFAEYMTSKKARAVMTKYGFVLPGEENAK